MRKSIITREGTKRKLHQLEKDKVKKCIMAWIIWNECNFKPSELKQPLCKMDENGKWRGKNKNKWEKWRKCLIYLNNRKYCILHTYYAFSILLLVRYATTYTYIPNITVQLILILWCMMQAPGIQLQKHISKWKIMNFVRIEYAHQMIIGLPFNYPIIHYYYPFCVSLIYFFAVCTLIFFLSKERRRKGFSFLWYSFFFFRKNDP